MSIQVRRALKKSKIQMMLEERVRSSNPLEVCWPGQLAGGRRLIGQWWRVWIEGRTCQYFAGYVSGKQEQAIAHARKYWPESVGKLVLTPRNA
jgi:hypothetical protein